MVTLTYEQKVHSFPLNKRLQTDKSYLFSITTCCKKEFGKSKDSEIQISNSSNTFVALNLYIFTDSKTHNAKIRDLNEEKKLAERTSSGKSFQILGASYAKLKTNAF